MILCMQASYLRPNLQVEATGSGGGFKGPGDDNGSSGNGGSGVFY